MGGFGGGRETSPDLNDFRPVGRAPAKDPEVHTLQNFRAWLPLQDFRACSKNGPALKLRHQKHDSQFRAPLQKCAYVLLEPRSKIFGAPL